MEEIEKRKVLRSSKVMTAIAANTIREIVKIANDEYIYKEDIVSLLKENGQFVLVYYK